MFCNISKLFNKVMREVNKYLNILQDEIKLITV